jgi:hypothetical protein
MDEFQELARDISSYQDMLILILPLRGFALTFRHADFGRGQNFARRPAWMPEENKNGTL